MAECITKDRHSRGERNRWAKLTDKQVREIKRDFRRRSHKYTNSKELAARYGVRTGQILAIVRGDAWRHVK